MNRKKVNLIVVGASAMFFIILGIIKSEKLAWIFGGVIMISVIFDWIRD